MTQFEISTRPIEGEKSAAKILGEQSGPEVLLAAVDAVLAVEGVEALGWTQYTPHFNDGDACEFGIHNLGVQLGVPFDLTAVDEDELEGVYGLSTEDGLWFADYDLYVYDTPGSYKEKSFVIGGQDSTAVHAAVQEFEKLLRSGVLDSVLLTNFGDHAAVIATAKGFQIEYAEHE